MLYTYLKTAQRNLYKHRLFSLINLGGLATGLAAFILIALYVADELSFDRYHANANRVFRLVQHGTLHNGDSMQLPLTSAPFAPALKTAFPEIQEAIRIDGEGGGIFSYGNKQLKAEDVIVSDDHFFDLFTCTFLAGNAQTALSQPSSIVLTATLARRLFGNTQQAVQQTLLLNKQYPLKVTAVIADLPGNTHLRFSGIQSFSGKLDEGWKNIHLYTYLLLKEGTDATRLQAKIDQLASHSIQQQLAINAYRLQLQPVTDIHLHSNLSFDTANNSSMRDLSIFIAAAGLILLIAMVNYMNLSTARAAERVKEIGVRRVIGASRRQLAGMFLAEAVVLSLLAVGLATLLVEWLLPYFHTLSSKNLSLWQAGVPFTLLLLLGGGILAGLASGLYPALFLSGFAVMPALKGILGNLGNSLLFRRSLVVFQFIITLCMLSGSLVIYLQMRYTLHKNLGFNKEQVLSFHIDDRQVRTQIPALKAKLLQSPLIEAAAAAGNPIGNNDLGTTGYFFEQTDGHMETNSQPVEELQADEDYLGTLQVKLVQGRNFSAQIPTDRTGSILINETLQRRLGTTHPVGKKAQFLTDEAGNKTSLTIIGVFKDFHTYSLQHKIDPMVLRMPPGAPAEDNLYVRIKAGQTAQALNWLRQVYKTFDAANPPGYRFLDQNFSAQYATEQKQEKIILGFTVLAVCIACLGLFGLVTFSVSQRMREIGIRKVLGATATHILSLVSKEFVLLVLLAIGIATPLAAWGLYRWLQHFAYRIQLNGWMFAAAGIIALLLALATVSIQAIRAAWQNPVNSLNNR